MSLYICLGIFSQGIEFYPESKFKSNCIWCHGQGQNIVYFVSGRPPLQQICTWCNGSGKTLNEYYYRNCGAAAGRLCKALDYICSKEYYKAYLIYFDLYKNRHLHNIAAEAAYWLGVSYELGFDIQQDTKLAYEYYEYAKNNNFQLAIQAIDRISRNGFYEANETNRVNFISNYINYLKLQNYGYQMMQDSYSEIDNMINETNKEIRDIRKNETKGCTYCNGTGHYSNPNERYFSSGTYRCQNCGKMQSYSYHHSCTCKKCGGTGSVKRW